MVCKKCNAKNIEGADTCIKCGNALAAPPPTAKVPPTAPGARPKAPPGAKKPPVAQGVRPKAPPGAKAPPVAKAPPGAKAPPVAKAPPSAKAPPVAQAPPTTPGAPEMTLSNLLFSFKGRIPRSTYWLKWTVPVIVLSIIFNILDPVLGTNYVFDPSIDARIGILSAIFSLLTIYPGIAVAVKRCHDRGRTGWFILLFFVPIVFFWPFIELLFLKGTTGANKYGPDPLSP